MRISLARESNQGKALRTFTSLQANSTVSPPRLEWGYEQASSFFLPVGSLAQVEQRCYGQKKMIVENHRPLTLKRGENPNAVTTASNAEFVA
jgi:hypothetical protein